MRHSYRQKSIYGSYYPIVQSIQVDMQVEVDEAEHNLEWEVDTVAAALLAAGNQGTWEGGNFIK